MSSLDDRIFNQILDTDDLSEAVENPLHTYADLNDWLEERNNRTHVEIRHIPLEECKPWLYDDEKGCIRNEDNTFFQIYGLKQYEHDKCTCEQPIILQDEIGFLGIITCKINDTWHYLMQAKIEPGNVNVVQISPTLQATKSNFTGKHGGRIPEYLDNFLHMDPKDVIVDQIQSEQSSRFLKKRNRNVIVRVKEELPEADSHRWMTLRQIKQFMKCENMVNMDTRTVLSCIPYVLMGQDSDVPFRNKSYFYKSAWNLNRKTIVELYHGINDYKMLSERRTEIVKISDLENWEMKDNTLCCRSGYPFRVIFCDITIEGREVTHWRQPLFASNGRAVFGLICCDDEGILKFLVKLRPEPGCFDGIEIGPTVQTEYSLNDTGVDGIESFFMKRLTEGNGILIDTILSEEGGRFYQEENRNVILSVDKNDLTDLPDGYVWSDYGTLNILTQINNCLNIQLRNLLSLLEL